MPKKITNQQDFDAIDDIIDGDYEDVSGLQDDIDGELSQLMADFDGGELDQLEVRVYRARQGKGQLAYVFGCLPTELPILDKLRDEYGGGDFEVRILKNKKIFRRFQVAVEAPVNKPQDSDDKMRGIESRIDEKFSRLAEILTAQQNQPPVDIVGMQSSMMQNMLAMKEILGNNTKQPSPISQLKEMLELKALLGGEKEEDKEANTNDVLVALINNVMPALGNLSSEEIASKNDADNSVIINKKQPVKQDPKKEKPMKMQLMYLCSMAKMDVDPTPYAQMTIDNTPQEKRNELLKFVSDPDKAAKEMFNIYKNTAYYAEWFAELGEIIKELLEEEALEKESDGIADEVAGDENLTRNENGTILAESKEEGELVSESVEKDNRRGENDSIGKSGHTGNSKIDETNRE